MGPVEAVGILGLCPACQASPDWLRILLHLTILHMRPW
jgi:hypothetical protein